MLNKLYVIGIGAGDIEGMTIKAYNTLKQCEVIVGYTVYIDLIKEYLPGKQFISTAMTKEVDRCIKALEMAEEGKITAVISSGDAGIYGMAPLVLELSERYDVDVEVICGVTAACSGGALLGAPISQDCCLISLSDLMIPWDIIEGHLVTAGKSDLCTVIYNPSSKKRADYLAKACNILLKYKSAETVCGLTKNIGRAGEETEITTLKKLSKKNVDMFTAVFVGNAETKVIKGKMVTPRGYNLNNSRR